MSDTQKYTLALVGSADVTEENARGVLDASLPDDLGHIFVPIQVPRRNAGLKRAIKWFHDELGADSTIPAADPIKALLEWRAEGEDVHLVMLFDPENPVDEEVALVEQANEAGIPVHNLAAAYDDILFEEDEPEVPEEPVAEDTVQPSEEEIEAAIAADGKSLGEQIAATEGLQEMINVHAQKAGGFTVNLNIPQDTLRALARAIVQELSSGMTFTAGELGLEGKTVPYTPGNTDARQGALKVREEDRGAPVTPITKNADEPRQDGAAYYYNEDKGSYRPARGRAKEGERKVFLNEEQEAEVKAAMG